jgi:branched-chain amino acid aminotransferase
VEQPEDRGMSVIWHNHTFKKEEPIFSFSDRIRVGDGIFDTMLAIDAMPIHAEMHFDRLLRHAEVLQIPLNLKFDAFLRNVKSLFERNNFVNGRFVVNTLVSRGPAERGLHAPENPKVQIAIRISRAPQEFPDMHAVLAQTVRRNEGSPLSLIKSVNYGAMVMALQEAERTGATEAILLNNRGYVTCATSSNIFAIKNKRLYTPPLKDGVMDGIIRQIMISRFKAVEKSLKPQHLFGSDGIYLTNSIKGAMPLKSLDGKKLPAPSLKIDKDFHLS